jgi:hypothetical protein
MHPTVTPEAYADRLNKSNSVWGQALVPLEGHRDVRLASARELTQRAGGSRKRQGYDSNRHSRTVFDSLELDGETIYSKHGNHSLAVRTDTRPLPGVMAPQVWHRLAGDDVVVVVKRGTEVGESLLCGAVVLPDNDPEIDVSDTQPTTRTRIANALDAKGVLDWLFSVSR